MDQNPLGPSSSRFEVWKNVYDSHDKKGEQ